jgi:hypothetical protein
MSKQRPHILDQGPNAVCSSGKSSTTSPSFSEAKIVEQQARHLSHIEGAIASAGHPNIGNVHISVVSEIGDTKAQKTSSKTTNTSV